MGREVEQVSLEVVLLSINFNYIYMFFILGTWDLSCSGLTL